jgi:hypothetical protein
VVPAATFGLLVSGFLAIVAFFSWLNKSAGLGAMVDYLIEKKKAQKAVEASLPYMIPKEREIIGYLLAKNQKVFEADFDGGHASTLISRRIIVRNVVRGQAV